MSFINVEIIICDLSGYFTLCLLYSLDGVICVRNLVKSLKFCSGLRMGVTVEC